MGPIVGLEKQLPVHIRQGVGKRVTIVRATPAGANILDKHSTALRAVTLPQLNTVGKIVATEEKRPIHVRGVDGVAGAEWANNTARKAHGAVRSAIALPQPSTGGPIFSHKEELP